MSKWGKIRILLLSSGRIHKRDPAQVAQDQAVEKQL